MCGKISIIMGIYNCEETLSEAIESILKQTYTNWELIMCDDASSDSTYQIAENYKDKYPEKIFLIRNAKNLRLAASLNRCLELATGKYVARMDSDDYSLPERLYKEVTFLEKNKEYDCVGTGLIIFDGDKERGMRMWDEYPTKETLLKGVPFAHPTIMMKKEVYDSLKGYTVSADTMRAEDADLWFRFFCQGYKGYVIQEALYRYRETKSDFKKRSLKAAMGTSKVYLKGFRMLNYSKFKYIYAFKPVLSACIPNRVMFYYHEWKDKLNSK